MSCNEVNDRAIQYGERIGMNMATAYMNGNMTALGAASNDLCNARAAIERNPDSLTRYFTKRDINLGVNLALASKGIERKVS
jgi:hypothetical protein